MHSSRMRTARLLTVVSHVCRGDLHPFPPPPRDIPDGLTPQPTDAGPPLDVEPFTPPRSKGRPLPMDKHELKHYLRVQIELNALS